MQKDPVQVVSLPDARDHQASMGADLELLWRLYDDHQQMARHHDSQRATFTQYILILAAGAAGVAKLGEFALIGNVVLGGFVVCVGLVGFWTTRRLSRACASEKECGNSYLRELQSQVPSLRPDSPHPHTGGGPWQTLSVLVVALGLGILICAFAPHTPAEPGGEAGKVQQVASTTPTR